VNLGTNVVLNTARQYGTNMVLNTVMQYGTNVLNTVRQYGTNMVSTLDCILVSCCGSIRFQAMISDDGQI
jgi:hypothetical protein